MIIKLGIVPMMKFFNSKGYDVAIKGDTYWLKGLHPDFDLKCVQKDNRILTLSSVCHLPTHYVEYHNFSLRNYVNAINSMIPMFIGTQILVDPEFKLNMKHKTFSLKADYDYSFGLDDDYYAFSYAANELFGYHKLFLEDIHDMIFDNSNWFYILKKTISKYALDDEYLKDR